MFLFVSLYALLATLVLLLLLFVKRDFFKGKGKKTTREPIYRQDDFKQKKTKGFKSSHSKHKPLKKTYSINL